MEVRILLLYLELAGQDSIPLHSYIEMILFVCILTQKITELRKIVGWRPRI